MTGAREVASFVVRVASWARNFAFDKGWKKISEPPLLTISLGNISFGGTGKTPLAIWLLSWLLGRGWRPCFISRGYRGEWEKRGGLVCDGRQLLATWKQAGDEPYMVAWKLRQIPVIVGRNRHRSTLLAAELGCNVAVLDDAFQHRQLARHLDLVLIRPQDRAERESWKSLSRADIILVQKSTNLIPKPALKVLQGQKTPPPLFAYDLIPSGLYLPSAQATLPPQELKGKKIVAFCGLASPQNFLRTLEELGASIQASFLFPDHHPYPPTSLKKILVQVQRLKPDWLVTTEKDAAKILDQGWPLGDVPLAILQVEFSAEGAFEESLEKWLEAMESQKEPEKRRPITRVGLEAIKPENNPSS